MCPVFLWGGADGIVERLRDRASWYARMAEDFAETADEGVENVPTAEELRLFFGAVGVGIGARAGVLRGSGSFLWLP